MALVHFDSFQRYSAIAAGTNGGLLEVYVGQNGTTRLSIVTVNGKRRINTQGASTGTGGFVYPVPTPSNQGYVQVYCQMDSVAAANTAPILMFNQAADGTSNTQCGIRVEDDGSIQAVRGYSTATIGAASAANVMLSGSIHCIEIEYVIHDTTGRLTVWVDNVQVLNHVNVDTKGHATLDTVGGIFMTGTQGTSNCQWTDLIVDDQPVRYGPRQIDCFAVSADTVDKDFVPSTGVINFAMIDEAQISNTDFVSGSIVGDLDLYETPISYASGVLIYGIKVAAYAQKTDAVARSIALPVFVSAQDDGANIALPAANATLSRYLLQNPNSVANWTPADLTALQVGLKVTV